MFEYNNGADPVLRKSPLVGIAGLLLGLAILLRIVSSFANTEKAFWACFLAWSILSIIEDFSSRKGEKPPPTELPKQETVSKQRELSFWWRAFGPLAGFNLITILLGLWPIGGLGILLWLISWIVYDYFESSRFGKRGLTTLSLR